MGLSVEYLLSHAPAGVRGLGQRPAATEGQIDVANLDPGGWALLGRGETSIYVYINPFGGKQPALKMAYDTVERGSMEADRVSIAATPTTSRRCPTVVAAQEARRETATDARNTGAAAGGGQSTFGAWCSCSHRCSYPPCSS